ncbi:hypothetical protein DDT54_11650 [Brenneria nigrifluens DSM 30175 = ATCC 13028]|uniref:Uncharacterized protein n=1 Tax=Brenneria nigrifluens DSM 30175 = ATCC 13028 TaxID=1121120 RepID=A0A2U1URB0_9GAMM|nr:hypothetical protein DDT54_11650 [Brenneria nigrifluens DSM 30175 = ATCC 13028]
MLASQTRHDYYPQSSMIREVMSPGLVGRWRPLIGARSGIVVGTVCNVDAGTCSPWLLVNPYKKTGRQNDRIQRLRISPSLYWR